MPMGNFRVCVIICFGDMSIFGRRTTIQFLLQLANIFEALPPQLFLSFATSAEQHSGGSDYHKTRCW